MTTLWGGAFSAGPAAMVAAFTESLSFDRILFADDCAVLAAHAAVLSRAGVLTPEEATVVRAALRALAEEAADGRVAFDPSDEDVHTTVERLLLERLPDVAPKVRAGLSRNDRVATAVRLWLRREGTLALAALCDLSEILCARAQEHADAIMPGYTHLQRAQPITLGHHLLAHVAAFLRDAERLQQALARADVSPLGAGALAGSTLGLDAAAAAADLGFREVTANSLDAVAARDHLAEFLAAAAICGVHCSRLGEEVVLWVSQEFGFATLDDTTATGSSLMPQKRNPDVAELARGKAGRLIGDLTSLLVTMKGLPLAYNRDLQEDKEPLFDAVVTLRTMLPALGETVRLLRFNTSTMAAAGEDPMLRATDAAEALVRAGVPFREAHEQVGTAVRQGMSLPAVGPGDAAASIALRPTPGPSRASVDAQLRSAQEALASLRPR